MDRNDPNTWTKDFVSSHQTDCLNFLRRVNAQTINLIRQKKYPAAIAGLDRIMNGLCTMHNGNCGNFHSHVSMFSLVEATIIAFGLDAPEDKRREAALKMYEDARDFAKSKDAKRHAGAVIADLQSGMSLSALKEEYCPDFPNATIDILQDLDQRLGSSISTKSKRKKGKRAVVIIAIFVIISLSMALSDKLPKSFRKSSVDYDAKNDPKVPPLENNDAEYEPGTEYMEANGIYDNGAETMEDPNDPASLYESTMSDGTESVNEGNDENAFASDNPALSYDSAILSGDWRSAERRGDEIWTSVYTLNEDGTFSEGAMGYTNVAYFPMPGETGWYIIPMGFPALFGTYIFDGQNLILHYTANEHNEYYGQGEEIVTISVQNLDLNHGVAMFDGVTYILNHDFSLSMENLCDMLGVDYSVENRNDNSLASDTPMPPYDSTIPSGDWRSAERRGNEIWTFTYTLNGDGTFFRDAMGYYNVAYFPWPGETGWYVMPMGFPSVFGTYIFDGQNLILHYAADEHNEYYGQGEEIVTISVQNLDLDHGVAMFDGIVYILDHDSLSMENLCDMLGVDYSVEF